MLQKDGSERMQTWLDQHQKNYISHATAKNTCDQNKILANIFDLNKIFPAEAAFRAGYQIIREKATKDVRVAVCLKNFPEFPEEILKKITSLNNSRIKRSSYISDIEDKLIAQHGNEITQKGINLPAVLEIKADMISENPIDKQLATLWNSIVQAENRGAKLDEIIDKRHQVIRSDAMLQTAIKATQNGIDWDYGDVVILRGNPESIIGYEVPGQVCLNEVSLLEPYQNNGEPFCLPLQQEDTIIIGPAKLLKAYLREDNSSANIVCIEDLTLEQRKILNIPLRLESTIANNEKVSFARSKQTLVTNFATPEVKAAPSIASKENKCRLQ